MDNYMARVEDWLHMQTNPSVTAAEKLAPEPLHPSRVSFRDRTPSLELGDDNTSPNKYVPEKARIQKALAEVRYLDRGRYTELPTHQPRRREPSKELFGDFRTARGPRRAEVASSCAQSPFDAKPLPPYRGRSASPQKWLGPRLKCRSPSPDRGLFKVEASLRAADPYLLDVAGVHTVTSPGSSPKNPQLHYFRAAEEIFNHQFPSHWGSRFGSPDERAVVAAHALEATGRRRSPSPEATRLSPHRTPSPERTRSLESLRRPGGLATTHGGRLDEIDEDA
ncbi:hypothetical protein PAPYR_2772 [Paratrimastix pyriformis]|uniref:Uncharacterized protein n=1 Tax=Paratrimastix pyriformis TaxID=342808 RepID=A0ABQ8UR44_9EUKA|nr:hypothetical protein PAPYR_2772 [Paratrimastix pyriformis]